MLRIKPLRLAGGYRVARSTTPEREKPRTGFVTLGNRRSWLQAFHPLRAWVRSARRLRRRPKCRPTASSATSLNPSQGRCAPVARTPGWGKSASPIEHNHALCKVRAVANQVGLVPAPLRPAAFAPWRVRTRDGYVLRPSPATATSASRTLLKSLISALALTRQCDGLVRRCAQGWSGPRPPSASAYGGSHCVARFRLGSLASHPPRRGSQGRLDIYFWLN
jgi:hypothetical protein